MSRRLIGGIFPAALWAVMRGNSCALCMGFPCAAYVLLLRRECCRLETYGFSPDKGVEPPRECCRLETYGFSPDKSLDHHHLPVH